MNRSIESLSFETQLDLHFDGKWMLSLESLKVRNSVCNITKGNIKFKINIREEEDFVNWG